MIRKKEGDKDDVKISEKSRLICLILRENDLMTLMTSFSKITKMAVNKKMEAAGWWGMM